MPAISKQNPMQKILNIALIIIVIGGCRRENHVDFTYVAEKFKAHSATIEKVEYNIQRIDTFAQGAIWNNKGIALLERDESDEVFGFSFYGKRDDIPTGWLYDKGYGFEISKEKKSYRIADGIYGLMGTPGGQMIVPTIFFPDSVYQSAELIEYKDRYLLKYRFEDDTTSDVTDIFKVIELDKKNFFPIKVTRSSWQQEKKSSSRVILSNVKINAEVTQAIRDYKNEIKDYELIPQEKRQVNRILKKKLPAISLVSLFNRGEEVSFESGKLILLDFWEAWCGPCIAALPKIVKLANEYSDNLQVVGIVVDDKEGAMKLIEKHGITFLNISGTKDLLDSYSVDSYPRYFLVDRNGIVQKEYDGFTEQMKKDIEELID
jgi:thiol-disulfide isomerase/thioredoxin